MAFPGLSSLRSPLQPGALGDADDPALVRRTLRGERQAFGALYERHADRVFRYLCFRVRDADLAHDLAQDVFLSALKGLPRLEHPERFGGWLMRIAHNRLVNHWERSAGRPDAASLDSDADGGEGVAGAATAAGATAATPQPAPGIDERLHVETLLADQLNPVQHQVVALRFAAGLSLRETAEIVGCTEAAAKQHQYRALRQIRAWLASEDGAADPGSALDGVPDRSTGPEPGARPGGAG